MGEDPATGRGRAGRLSGVRELAAGAGEADGEEALERETLRWALLEVVEPVEAPEVGDETAPRVIDARLRELSAMRRDWDDLVGQLADRVRRFALWKDLGFANFEHYCAERLGLAPRTSSSGSGWSGGCARCPGCGRPCVRGG